MSRPTKRVKPNPSSYPQPTGPSTWSSTNLLATPSPTHDSITLTHFTGIQPARLTFLLPLPTRSSTSPNRRHIKRLSFGPDSGVLLAVVSGEGGDEEGDGERVIIWNMNDTIDAWSIVFDEPLEGLLAPGSGDGRKTEVVESRWLGEQRKWYPAPRPEENEGAPTPTRPLFCAPLRSPPVLGCSVVFVLDTSSLLFLHLPPPSSSSPPTYLHLPLSFPASSVVKPYTPTAQSAIDNLVKSLISESPASIATDIGAGGGEKALKVELGKRETKVKGGEKCSDAAVGAVRNSGSAFDFALTTLLIAYIPAPRLSFPPSPPSKSAAQPKPKVEVPDDDPWSSLGMGMGELDEAFGGSGGGITVVKQEEDEGEEGGVRGGRRRTNEVRVTEVRIDVSNLEGIKISLKPLSPLHPSTPPFRLFWTEDTTYPSPSVPPVVLPPLKEKDKDKNGEREKERDKVREVETARSRDGDKEGDGRLVVLGFEEVWETERDHNEEEHAMLPEEDLGQTIESWGLSYGPYQLSEAFSNLDCKKSDKTTAGKEWAAAKVASARLPQGGILRTVLSPGEGGGPIWNSFLGVVEFPSTGERNVVVFDSTSLQPKSVEPIRLPDQIQYDHISVSPNKTLVCATATSQLLLPESEGKSVVLAAMNCGGELSTSLALALASAIVKQLDTSDAVGRVVGLKDDAKVVDILRKTRDTLQDMLPPSVLLAKHSLQFELLGVLATVYSAVPSFTLRGEIAHALVHIAGCARAFQRCEKKERGLSLTGYRCESDAVWPLIGYLTWYCDFCRQLALECKATSASEEPSPRLVLLLHPLPRTQLLLIADAIIGLQGFLTSFRPNTNATVDVSRSVLDDVVDFNGLVVKEWRTVLSQIGDFTGLSGDSLDLRDLMLTLSIPESLLTASAIVSATLATAPIFASNLLPTPPTTPKRYLSTLSSIDVVRRGRLPAVGKFKKCSKCGERTERNSGASENEMGRWSGWEMAWEGRCACGGLWVGEERKG